MCGQQFCPLHSEGEAAIRGQLRAPGEAEHARGAKGVYTVHEGGANEGPREVGGGRQVEGEGGRWGGDHKGGS